LRALLQELRTEHQLSWKQLALRLEALGHPIDDRVLANRINRGAISAGFALLMLEAIGMSKLYFPRTTSKLRASR